MCDVSKNISQCIYERFASAITPVRYGHMRSGKIIAGSRVCMEAGRLAKTRIYALIIQHAACAVVRPRAIKITSCRWRRERRQIPPINPVRRLIRSHFVPPSSSLIGLTIFFFLADHAPENRVDDLRPSGSESKFAKCRNGRPRRSPGPQLLRGIHALRPPMDSPVVV